MTTPFYYTCDLCDRTRVIKYFDFGEISIKSIQRQEHYALASFVFMVIAAPTDYILNN